jgi:hypothetical protein
MAHQKTAKFEKKLNSTNHHLISNKLFPAITLRQMDSHVSFPCNESTKNIINSGKT